MRLGIAVNRAATMDATWTTVHLAVAALRRGHEVRIVERGDFEVDRLGTLVARAHAFQPPGPAASRLVAALADRSASRRSIDVGRLDLLLLRVTALDAAVLTFASLARDRGVRVVNDPDGVARVSHKAWLAAQAGVPTPATLITRSEGAAEIFHSQERAGVVVKPARGSGGRHVTRVRRGDRRGLQDAFGRAREAGDGYVVLQAYLPEATEGEKRLVWLDGALIGGYLRRRAPGEFRHNLKRGAIAAPTPVTEEDRELANRLTRPLLAAGVRLVGLDVIGGLVTEVNALNPGGAFHTDRLTGSRLAELIVTRLEGSAPAPPDAERTPWLHRAP